MNAVDYSGYPDCRPQYVHAFQRVIDLGTKRTSEGYEIELRTPLIHMTKSQIIKEGFRLGVDFSQTLSCYRGIKRKTDHGPIYEGCGKCDSCILRDKGFEEYYKENKIVKNPI